MGLLTITRDYRMAMSLTKSRLFAFKPQRGRATRLGKMKAMHELGLEQGIFAPHARPDINVQAFRFYRQR